MVAHTAVLDMVDTDHMPDIMGAAAMDTTGDLTETS